MAFSGGLLGAAFVLVNAFNAPVLGTSLAVSIVLLGQVAAGLLLDHRGWLGVRPRPVTLGRFLGAALVLAGVALVRFAVRPRRPRLTPPDPAPNPTSCELAAKYGG